MIQEWLCTSSASIVGKAQQRRNTFWIACMTVHFETHSRPRLPIDNHFKPFFDCVVRNKRSRREFDRDDGDSQDQDSKPSPSGGAGRHPTPGTDGVSSSTSRGTGNHTDQGDSGGGGAGPMSMASALSLFAPPADRDAANEMDLLDMVDENEQYEIVRSFAEKHIVPYMRQVE